MILKTLRAEPSISRADLAKRTMLSRPTVSSIVNELIEEGFVTEVGIGTSSGGRKPILLQYNAAFQFVIGAVVEGDQLSMALANLDGEEIEELSFDLQLPMPVGDIFELLDKGVSRFVLKHCEGRSQIVGLTLGVPGILQNDSFRFLHSPGIIIQSEEEIEACITELGIPTSVENDVNLMAIGEFSKRQEDSLDSLLLIYASRGIGSGLIMNGQLQRGHSHAAGEIGSMLIGKRERMQENMGVFESNYGALGVSQSLEVPVSKAIDFMVHNSRHNKEVAAYYAEYLDAWEQAILNVIAVTNPQVVVLSGHLKQLGSPFIKRLGDSCRAYLPMKTSFEYTKAKRGTGLSGAISLALQTYSIFGKL